MLPCRQAHCKQVHCASFLVADYAFKAIDALPVTAHPMTQFATGVMALQVDKWTSEHNFFF
jgi:hypothetical protein